MRCNSSLNYLHRKSISSSQSISHRRGRDHARKLRGAGPVAATMINSESFRSNLYVEGALGACASAKKKIPC